MQGKGLRRPLAVAVGSGLILTIAASRLLLDAHSLAEVGLGLVIGTISLVLFSRNLPPRYRQTKVWPLLVTVGVLVAILHGQKLHAEEFLHRITGYLHINCS
jgi:hypothetical protein